MTSPLASLAQTINDAASFLFFDATLVRDVPGVSSDPADPAAPTQTPYTCKAIVENYNERLRLDGTVKMNDRKVMILAKSLTVVPTPGDRVTISGITFTIDDVATDPATAVWTCKGQIQ